MAPNPVDKNPGLGRLQGWWLALPLSYRVNALLYFLAGVFLLGLLATVVGGDDSPRQVQVGAGVNPTTTVARSSVPPTTTATTSGQGSTSSTAGATTSTTRAASSGTTATTQPAGNSGGGGGNTSTTSGSPTSVTSIITCLNSTDERCGTFRWTTEPGGDSPLVVNVSMTTDNRRVTFVVTATDPDRVVTDNCAEIRYGDGASEQTPCNPPPCPPAYGAWDLPAKASSPSPFQRTYVHDYSVGSFIASFKFVSKESCRDPYGSEGQRSEPVVIVSVTTSSSSSTSIAP